MFSVSPIISTPLPPAVAAVVVNPAPTDDVAIGRLPSTTVARPIEVPEALNNSRGNGSLAFQFANPTPALAPNPPLPTAPNAVTAALRQGFSSTFLAQLFAQGSTAEGDALVVLFENAPLPTLDLQTLNSFAQTKFLPSNAALPAPPKRQNTVPAQAVSSEAGRAGPTPAATNNALQNLRSAFIASQPAASAPLPLPQQANTGNNLPAAVSFVPAEPQTTAYVPKPIRPAQGAGRSSSLLEPRGSEGYKATQTRNETNLFPQNEGLGPLL